MDKFFNIAGPCKPELHYVLPPLAEGLEQTVAYAERCGAEEAHLPLFERRAGVGWSERIFSEERAFGGYPVRVWGM